MNRDFDTFLKAFGWSESFQAALKDCDNGRFLPGRVVGQGKGHYRIQVSTQESLEAAITTKFHDAIKGPVEFPTVGDWVVFDKPSGSSQAIIHGILKRKNLIQRMRVGRNQGSQLIAANVDFMLIVSSCDEEFDLQRLGRYVALGAAPKCKTVLILTKSDLSKDPDEFIQRFKNEHGDVEVMAVSNTSLQSLERLHIYFGLGRTSVLIGSSGVGKSTLTNYFLGFDAQKTGELGQTSKGRHTTTSRNLLVTRWGGLVIDTPGMQEISVSGQEADTASKFADVEALILECKFTDCQHKNEPQCAIKQAIATGTLSEQRWQEYTGVLPDILRPKKVKKSKYPRR